MSASLTLLNVSARPSARSLSSSSVETSFSKSTSPFCSSDVSCPTSSSSPCVNCCVSFNEAIEPLLACQERVVVPATRLRPMENSEQVSERLEVQVQVAVLETELALQLLHPLLELHERLAEPFDLLVRQRPLVHPAQRLPLHQLAEQLDQRQHELSQALLD